MCYILDEADIHFGAREYADHGRSVNFYNKQHRKLSDTVYYCCQSAEQLDKQIRMLAQQTIVLKNLGKQKKGIFSLPQVFCWSAYYQVPKLNDRPMSSGVFRLKIDNGLQDCFETAAGVGLAGTKADRGEKQKGFSLLWAIPAIAVVGFLLIKAPLWFARGLSSATMGATKAVPESYRLAAPNMTNETPRLFGKAAAPVPVRTNGFFPLEHGAEERQRNQQQPKKVFLTGISTFGGRTTVYLSNGDVYTSADKKLQFVSKQMAIIRGKTYRFPR